MARISVIVGMIASLVVILSFLIFDIPKSCSNNSQKFEKPIVTQESTYNVNFYKEYRPILDVIMKKQDNGLFWTVSNADDLKMLLYMEFVVINRGTATAMDIKFPDRASYSSNNSPPQKFKLKMPPTISLPPNGSFMLEMPLLMGPYPSPERLERALNAFSTNEENIITTDFKLSYSSEVDRGLVYETDIQFEITGKKYRIRKSNYVPPVLTQKPRLIFNLKKFDDGTYWNITTNENEINVAIRLSVKNIGLVSAKNATILTVYAHPAMNSDLNSIKYQNEAHIITIPPKNKYDIEINLKLKYNNIVDKNRQLYEFNTNKNASIDFKLSYKYVNEGNDEQKFTATVKYKIKKNVGEILELHYTGY